MKHKLPKLIIASFALLLPLVGSAQSKFAEYAHDLSYFIPKTQQMNGTEVALEGKYNSAIPTPKQVLGFELGQQYCDWGNVLRYMEILDKASDRIQIVELGYTCEYRRMIQLIISSPKNLVNLAQIKADHIKLSDPAQSASLDIKQMPLVADITCSIHGNEASGTNASLAMAYHFAASEDAPVLEMLDKMVLLIEPGMNPDGYNNFATWCNYTVGSVRNLDKSSYENSEPWPGNRGNHYYANLNRDLLMCQHPEGRVGVTHYLEWLPNLVLDLHEKGSGATFFHSPGHPKRLHPYVTTRNQELTGEVGKYISNALTPIGAKPYSGRDFDDLYLGKGAAYGDVHGSVCLLFEQPNSRNYASLFKEGVVVSLPSGIRSQTYASLAALGAGYDMRETLLNHQREFYQKSATAMAENEVKGYIFHARGDKARAYRLLENLAVHQVEVYHLAKDVKVGKEKFLAGESFVIPLENQRHYYMTKAIWEKLGLDAYQSKKFYDISTWTFPLAYNVAHADLTSVDGLLGERADVTFPEGKIIGEKSTAAYTFEATGLYSFNLIRALLLEGVGVKIARKPFKAEGHKMGYGSAVVEVADNNSDKVYNILTKAAKENGVDVYALSKPLNTEKLDLADAQLPKVAIVTGNGMSGTSVGEIWMMLDNHYGISPTRLTIEAIAKMKSLSKYNVIIVADGVLPRKHQSRTKIQEWAKAGGTLIMTKEAHRAANGTGLTQIKRVAEPEKGVENVIKGMILNATIDTTSPLGYGYTHNELPLMKVGVTAYENPVGENAVVPLRYTANPYLSGYISQVNLDRFASSPAAIVTKCGKGRVIHFADNPVFRSYWYGGNKMFMNAVYFGHLY